MPLARKNIQNITVYSAGKPIEETKRELKIKSVIKLASNENPLGVSPKAVSAIRKSASSVYRYPDSQGFYLKNKIVMRYGLLPGSVVLGNGSDELIDIIIKAFVEEDENILTADTTFVEYEILSKILGRRVTTVPLVSFKYDLQAIKKCINKKTKVIFIANPNNPTGTYVNRQELYDFVKTIPKKTILVLDEAYDAFIDVKDFPDTLSLLKYPNVIILKTFSKAYGLAGLRIGYALSNQGLTRYMEKARQPFNVNMLAQIAAIAALDDKGFLAKTRAVVLKGKKYLYRELDKLGLSFVDSVANFILIDVGRDCLDVFNGLLKKGVIVRDMKQYGLNSFIRVTIGTDKENRKFISALKSIL